MKKIILPSLLLILCCQVEAEACAFTGDNSISSATQIINSIPGRIQWNENNGYCGEVSIISAGLHYGQYVSQYEARNLANLSYDFKHNQFHEILLGYKGDTSVSNNVIEALENMHLTYEEYNNTNPYEETSKSFLSWVKGHVVNGYPVAIGVYENSSVFAQQNPDPEYDHIVPVFGFSSKHNLQQNKDKYFPNDTIYIHDNGLFTGTRYSKANCYSYNVKYFQNNRKDANRASSPIYSVSDNANNQGNFGVAVTGLRVTGSIPLLPVSITTNPVDELPEIGHHSNIEPEGQNLQLTITVSNLKANNNYILYHYNSFDQLPIDDNFSLSIGSPVSGCIINANSKNFIMNDTINANDIAIYRAVPLLNSPTSNLNLDTCTAVTHE